MKGSYEKHGNKYPPQSAGYPSTSAGTYGPQEVVYDRGVPDYYGEQKRDDLESQQTVYGKENHYDKPTRARDGPLSSTALCVDTPESIRRGFIRKVYLILSCQLAYTFGFGAIFVFAESARLWLREFWYVALIFSLVGFGFLIAVSCSEKLGRTHPTNLIILSIITMCLAWMIAVAGASTNSVAFCAAAAMTTAVVLGLTLFAIQTKIDFTGFSAFILVALIILVVFGIFALIFNNEIVNLIYASLGAALFSFIIVYDTQKIVGGKHRKYQYSIDDYVFAALTLYLDVINLFLYILQIMQATNVGN